MLTFEQFIKGNRNDTAVIMQNEVMLRKLSEEPVRITPIKNYDINRMFNVMGVVIGERKEECDNRVDGIFLSKLILKHRKIVSDTSGEDFHYYLTIPDIYHFMQYSNYNLSENNPLFAVYTIPLVGHTNMEVVKNNFRVFNYYQSLQGKIEDKALKMIKTLEFAKENTKWLDGWDIGLNTLRLRHLPEDQLTDDDHALNAAHNL